jgi:hypothetical protein
LPTPNEEVLYSVTVPALTSEAQSLGLIPAGCPNRVCIPYPFQVSDSVDTPVCLDAEEENLFLFSSFWGCIRPTR